ncbi:MAG: hypothetical protein H7240_12375 [Glaciimonas sp.]|nr:hypothetical protein [Glaciimonas sp.]
MILIFVAYKDGKNCLLLGSLDANVIPSVPNKKVAYRLHGNGPFGNDDSWGEMIVQPLSGGFTSATPDQYTSGKVNINAVTKGNGANSE